MFLPPKFGVPPTSPAAQAGPVLTHRGPARTAAFLGGKRTPRGGSGGDMAVGDPPRNPRLTLVERLQRPEHGGGELGGLGGGREAEPPDPAAFTPLVELGGGLAVAQPPPQGAVQDHLGGGRRMRRGETPPNRGGDPQNHGGLREPPPKTRVSSPWSKGSQKAALPKTVGAPPSPPHPHRGPIPIVTPYPPPVCAPQRAPLPFPPRPPNPPPFPR